jgi:hypothetical protein
MAFNALFFLLEKALFMRFQIHDSLAIEVERTGLFL